MNSKKSKVNLEDIKTLAIQIYRAANADTDYELQANKLVRTFTVVGNNSKYEQYSNGKIVKTVYENASTQIDNLPTGPSKNRKPRRARKSTNNGPDAA